MKRLLLLALTAGLLSPIAAKADLVEANLSTDQVAKRTTPSNDVYEAWCGVVTKESKIDCLVQFKNDRLTVNNSTGVSPKEITTTKFVQDCKFGAFHSRKCTMSYSFDYPSGGETKTALITYKNHKTNKKFMKDLELWLGKEINKECTGRTHFCEFLPSDPASRSARALEKQSQMQGVQLLQKSVQPLINGLQN